MTFLGVRVSTEPERYLGLSNIIGRNKKWALQHLKDRLRTRIENWCIRPFSHGWKMIFIRSVLQAIPTFSMSCSLLPLFFFVWTWKELLADFGGRIMVGVGGSIGVIGLFYVILWIWAEWVSDS